MQGKASQRPDCGCDPPPPESKDASAQRAVLALVLDAYPERLTILGLAQEIDQGDAAERACRALVSVGLLECDGRTIWATRAAIHFDQLELP